MIRFGKTFSCSGSEWQCHTYVHWNAGMVERHRGKCTCSHCNLARWPIAYWSPQCKAWNAWRTVVIRLYGSRWYIRWTRPKLQQTIKGAA